LQFTPGQFAGFEEVACKAVYGRPVLRHGLAGAIEAPTHVSCYAFFIGGHKTSVDLRTSEVGASAEIVGLASVPLLSFE